jgi:hypothetical protein
MPFSPLSRATLTRYCEMGALCRAWAAQAAARLTAASLVKSGGSFDDWLAPATTLTNDCQSLE